MRSTAANAQLALLLEVSGTPKPGNVDREREYPDLRFEEFLAGAVGARPGLEAATDPATGLGEAFERAVAGMAAGAGTNTQFGAVLLVTPLARTAATGDLTPDRAAAVVGDTGVEDAAAFYRAFEHVDVAVRDPPEGMEPLDVRRGADAVPVLRERSLTLADVMERSADRDGIAREWTGGFGRTFATAARIRDGEGPVGDRAARAYLELLADEPDPFVVTRQDAATAREVRDRARELRESTGDGGPGAGPDPDRVRAFAEDLVDRGINPGTTADIVAGGLFVALERDGLEVGA